MNLRFLPYLVPAIFSLLFQLSASGQEITNEWMEDLVQEIVENNEEEVDFSSLLEQFATLKEHPMDINHAAKEELEQLYLLNDFQVASLLDYITEHGKLTSIFELQYVPGFTVELAQKLQPFVRVSLDDSPTEDLEEIASMHGSNQLVLRTQQVLEEQAGFRAKKDTSLHIWPGNKYEGSPGKYYLRWKYGASRRLDMGITAEKDNGEHFLTKGSIPLPDYLSGYLSLNGLGYIKTLAIGDFQAGFGQGLALWSGYSFGKGPALQNVRKVQTGIKPHTSTDENRFFRGIGTTLTFGSFDGSIFFSKKQLDANVSWYDSLREEPVIFTSFVTGGLHTNAQEIQNRDAIQEEVLGGNLSYRGSNFKLGATGIKTTYNAYYSPYDRPDNEFAFRGRSLSNASVDYVWKTGNLLIFGEEAWSSNGGLAFFNSLSVNVPGNCYISLVHRNYARDYATSYASPFSEYYKGSNEQGWFAGASIKSIKHTTLTAYLDLYHFPWLRYNVNGPSGGRDLLILAEYTPNDQFEVSVRFQSETSGEKITSDAQTYSPLGEKRKDRFRVNMSFSPYSSVTLRSRLEMQTLTAASGANEHGFLVYQDVLIQPTGMRSKWVVRYALFETDGYESRIYSWENDLQNVYAVPFYYGKGSRIYLLFSSSQGKRITYWIKCARTLLPGRNSIGSGLGEISDDHKTELGIQVRFRF